MNSLQRTLVFVVAAIVSTGLAYTASEFTKPKKLAEHGEFGKDFFPEFTDPSKASAIRVVTFDEETAVAKDFTVVNKDGWRIKSHNDYPADGKDQLAKAAASVISLKRGSLMTQRTADHERLGVIDPLDEKNTVLKGRGSRITLFEKGDTALADFIIGKKVEGSDDKRYVRKADEQKVYVIAMRFDVSTKFADWAETNLLKLNGTDLVKIRASQPKYNDQEELEGVEVVELDREKSADPWKLAGNDDATEELKTEEINTMVTTLSDLRLVGVRPKPAFKGQPVLNADLKIQLPKELAANPQIRNEVVEFVQSNLREKGFFLGKGEAGERQIVSREGELTSSTKDGIVYRLTFGSVFTGTDEEIETGSKEEPKEGEASKKKVGKDKADAQKKSRYLFVRAEFDEKLLGEPPTEPVKPEPPPGVEAPADLKSDGDAKKDEAKKSERPESDTKSEEKKADEKKPEDKDSKEQKPTTEDKSDKPEGAKGDDKVAASEEAKAESDVKKDEDKKDAPAETKEDKPKTDEKGEKKAADDKPAETKTAEEKKPEEKKDEPKPDLKAEYFDALKRYDAEKGRYNTEVKLRESKIETGTQKVKELNDRFADWYYVISNDSFDKLRLNRASLIKVKEKTLEKTSEANDENKDDVKPSEPKKSDEPKVESKKEEPKPVDSKKEEPAKEETKKEESKKEDAKPDAEKKEGDAAKSTDADKPTESK
ncbi:MAG: DUF4340 domain-containing protein [Planctomycetia bacterium]|nr:DUF4340 domain-containing protein [Planctomycetia bacterium]